MNATARQLLELQKIDLEIKGKKARLEDIEAQLADETALVEARREVEDVERRLQELSKALRSAEADAADQASKVAELDKKLYGGTVRNPRELSDLQADVEHLRARLRKQEDVVLELMTEVEAGEDELAGKKRALSEVEADRAQLADSLEAERSELERALAALEAARLVMVAAIQKDGLGLYERLRGPKNGHAVALVEQGRCQGCRIALPLGELQRARAGRDLVQCGHCERILLVS